ncbi:hypothetical protein O7635_12085 [Asanoa sp. WMMD1127]|uniref:hypothetical protein n=1 Tax=Asanoa sp. WMMD1127 TaxID=3016107 RepID=UPI0024177614|nr:hypothetical protein [Asanoa sp. WMMD1127]MDG4822591.1 hypothetical protein [Asanoa sp. WMMD1127]
MTRELRRALRELTDVPPPPDLAARSIRLAERRRRTRIALGAVAAAVVAVSVAVPLVLRPDRHSAPVPIAPTPSVSSDGTAALPETPQVVAFAYARATPISSGGWPPPGDSYVLDRSTGQYRTIPYEVVVPSPDGKRFFVADAERGGIMEGARGSVHWVEAYDRGARGVEWSPDGREVLITSLGKDEPGGFTVVDSKTFDESRFVPMVDIQSLNARGLGFFWSRDGRSIGHTLTTSDTGSDPDRALGIRFYDLSGRTLRTVELDGTAAVRTTADVSPDGRRAVAVDDWGNRHVRIVDLESGAVIGEFAGSGVVGWYDDEHLVLRNNDELQVVDFTGQVVRRVPGSANLLTGAVVHLVPADGLPAASARYAF